MENEDQILEYLVSVRDDIREIEKVLKKKPKRDAWDIVAIAVQALSGVVIAGIGIYVSVVSSAMSASTQETISRQSLETQRTISEQSRLSDYLRVLADSSQDETKRANMVELADLAAPSFAAKIAARYATTDSSDTVRIAAIKLLGSLRRPDMLRILARNTDISPPVRSAIGTALGLASRGLLIRISNIDDLGILTINGKQFIQVTYHNDTGWLDVSSAIQPGKNKIQFELDNGPYGGWAGQFELSSGGHLYDSGLMSANACPCNAKVLTIDVEIQVANDRTVTAVTQPKVTYF